MPIIRVRIVHCLAEFDVFGVESIKSILTDLLCDQTHFEVGGPTGTIRRSVRRPMYLWDARGRSVVPIGLLPRVASRLQLAGYTLSITYLDEPNPRLVPEQTVIDFATEQERELMLAVIGHSAGRIVVADDRQIVAAIGAIAAVFRYARIQVAPVTHPRIRRLYGMISLRCRQRVYLGFDRVDYDPIPHVVVCPVTKLQTIACDIVLLPDLDEAVGDRAMKHLAHARNHLVFGFQRPGTRSPQKQLRMEAVAGPVIYTVPELRTEVGVVMIGVQHGSARAARESQLKGRRRSIWCNSLRNSLIAAAAGWARHRAANSANLAGVHLLEQDLSVMILVDYVEHGQPLLEHLPGWRLLSHRPSQDPMRARPENVSHAADGAQRPTAVYRMTAASSPQCARIGIDLTQGTRASVSYRRSPSGSVLRSPSGPIQPTSATSTRSSSCPTRAILSTKAPPGITPSCSRNSSSRTCPVCRWRRSSMRKP